LHGGLSTTRPFRRAALPGNNLEDIRAAEKAQKLNID